MCSRAGQIAIAGAGIAGLTAALCFARAGFSVAIFEKSEKLEEIGAGIQLSPNATRILDRLGVLRQLEAVAVKPSEIAIRRADTLRRIASVPLGAAAALRWGAPYLTIHRGDLHAALLTAAKEQDGITVNTGTAARDVSFAGGRVVVGFEPDSETYCDLAVGADGVWSSMRGQVTGANPSHYTGYLAWRAMLRGGSDLVPADRVTTFVHPNFHLVAYPVRAGNEINLVAVTRSQAAPKNWVNASDAARLEAAMKAASPALIELVERAGPWTTWPIHEVPQDGAWTDPAGIALIGDAAHAMSPYAAQGAAMAIEDAFMLAGSYAAMPERPAGALSAYEKSRRARVKRVAARGRFNRFAWHAWGPVALCRDFVLSRRKPESLAADLDWLYGWEPDTEIT